MIPVNQHHLGSAPRNSRASHGTPPRLPALRRASIRGFPRAGEARLGESPKPEQVGSLTSSHHPKNAPFTTRLVPQNHRDLMWRVQPAPTERRVHGHICARSLHRFKSILILDLLPAGALLASWIDAKIDTRKQSHGSGNWPGLRTFRFLAESSCPRNSKTLGSPSCWSPRKTSGTLLIDQTPNLFWGFTIQMEGGASASAYLHDLSLIQCSCRHQPHGPHWPQALSNSMGPGPFSESQGCPSPDAPWGAYGSTFRRRPEGDRRARIEHQPGQFDPCKAMVPKSVASMASKRFHLSAGWPRKLPC